MPCPRTLPIVALPSTVPPAYPLHCALVSTISNFHPPPPPRPYLSLCLGPSLCDDLPSRCLSFPSFCHAFHSAQALRYFRRPHAPPCRMFYFNQGLFGHFKHILWLNPSMSLEIVINRAEKLQVIGSDLRRSAVVGTAPCCRACASRSPWCLRVGGQDQRSVGGSRADRFNLEYTSNIYFLTLANYIILQTESRKRTITKSCSSANKHPTTTNEKR